MIWTPKLSRWGTYTFYSAMFLAGLAYLSLRLVTPTISAPHRPNLPAKNGYTLLSAAAGKTAELSERKKPTYRKKITDWTLAEKKEAVAPNREAIRVAKEALRYPYQEENHVVTLENSWEKYGSFRTLTRALTLAGDIAWAEGRHREAVDYYVDGIAIGRRIPHHVGLDARLIGLACESIARSRVWAHLDEMDTDTAKNALKRLEALDTEWMPLSETLEEEKYTALCVAMEAMGHPQEGQPRKPERKDFLSYANIVPPMYVVNTMGAHFDDLIAQARRPYIEGNAEIDCPREVYAAILSPVVTSARAKDTATRAGDRLIRTALALHIYKMQPGALPVELSELVTAKLLTIVPEDPFAKPGTPLQYKPLAGGKYLLYSIGPDGKDDNGKGMESRTTSGITTRLANANGKGDMVVGWYPY